MSNKPKILLIDDDKDFCEKVIFQYHRSYVIDYQLSVELGLKALQENRYSLILLDLVFDKDESEGLKAIPKIRDVASLTPIIIISQTDKTQIAAATIKNGAKDFLNKKEVETFESWKRMFDASIKQYYKDIDINNVRLEFKKNKFEKVFELIDKLINFYHLNHLSKDLLICHTKYSNAEKKYPQRLMTETTYLEEMASISTLILKLIDEIEEASKKSI